MFKQKSSLLLILLMLLLSIVIVACTSSSEGSETEATSSEETTAEDAATEEEAPAEAEEEVAEEEPMAEEAAEEAMAEEVVIQHAQGETAVPLNPQTVVVLDYSLLDTLDTIGAPVSSVIQGPLMPAHLEKYNGEEYTNAGSLFEPDFEAINALEPDLILVALRSSTSYEPLSEIAPTLDLTPNTLEDAAAYATNLGTVFGKEAELPSS